MCPDVAVDKDIQKLLFRTRLSSRGANAVTYALVLTHDWTTYARWLMARRDLELRKPCRG